MNEATIRREVYALVKELGYWPLRGRDATVCPNCHTKILPPIGRPDIIVLSPVGLSRVIEAKIVDMEEALSLPFSKITKEQNEWLDSYIGDGGIGYLAVGTIKERGRRLWIIDWDKFKQIRDTVLSLGSENIPIDISKMKKCLGTLKNAGADLVNLASEYELGREGGWWVLPQNHSLRNIYGNQKRE